MQFSKHSHLVILQRKNPPLWHQHLKLEHFEVNYAVRAWIREKNNQWRVDVFIFAYIFVPKNLKKINVTLQFLFSLPRWWRVVWYSLNEERWFWFLKKNPIHLKCLVLGEERCFSIEWRSISSMFRMAFARLWGTDLLQVHNLFVTIDSLHNIIKM